jgi:hypothetical protein
MARYRLLAQHFSEEDKLLEPGTEVGDGTEHIWTRAPTSEMEALDEEGRQLVARERIRAGEHVDPVDALPMTMAEANSPAQPRRRHRKRQPEPPEAAGEAPPD